MKRTLRFFIAGAALSVALAAVLLVVSLTSATAPAISVSGAVVFPDGTPPSLAHPLPPGTFVWIMRPEEWPPTLPDPKIYGRSQVVTSTGEFSFANVPPGGYLLRAVPPATSIFAPSFIVPLHVLTQSVVLPDIWLTLPSVTGTVYAPGGVTPTNAIVRVFAGPTLVERRFTANGKFAIGGLPAGEYQLFAEPLPDDMYWSPPPITITLTPTAPQYVSLTLRPPMLGGVVLEGAGPNPVPEARVLALAAPGVERSDLSGPAGKFAIGGLPGGITVTLIAEPPPGRGDLLPAPPQVISIPRAMPLTIRFGTPPKVVEGIVRTNVPAPVAGAVVEAHRVDKLGHVQVSTSPTGTFHLRLSPGVWAVNVHPISGTVPPNWVYPYPAQLVRFENNAKPERKPMEFVVLTADAHVGGAVQLPNGQPPSAAGVTVTVGLHTDEGIGLTRLVDPAGRFGFKAPHGVYKLDLRVESLFFAAPPPIEIHAPALVPTLTLIPRNAIITGTLTEEGSGLPVADVPVIAWNLNTRATFASRSGPDGVYVTPVYSGTWLVRPAPRPEQPFVFTGKAAEIRVAANRLVGGVNFDLVVADAVLQGVMVDGSGNPAPSANGWADAVNADRTVRTGAPVEAGRFSMMLPAGAYSVTVHLPGTQPFMSDGRPRPVTVAAGATTKATFVLIKKLSMIRGAVWDKRADVSVDADGKVWAWDNGLWTGTDIKPGGFYTLPVPGGDWSVDYAINPESAYIKAAGPRTYAVPPNQVIEAPLPVVEKDGWLTGTVLMPDGSPAAGAVVIAEAVSKDIEGLTLRSRPTRPDGQFALKLPGGQYRVRSAMMHDPGLINPALKLVDIPRGGSSRVTLQYRQPDAVITGTVSLAAGSVNLPAVVHLWAWSADDGYNAAIAPLNGVYTLPVTSGRNWNIAAVLERPDHYWFTRTLVAVAPPGAVNQDLKLQGPSPKPGPVTAVFDAAESRLIELADGTRIFIPAGAMPVDGRVILHITPLAAAPRHRNGDVLGLSYVFEAYTEDGQPITENFDQDVVITFKYDPADLIARGIDVDRLRPAYFSTTTNNWTAPDSFVVDERQHEITMQIDHFTDYTILSIEAPSTTVYTIFLPAALKGY